MPTRIDFAVLVRLVLRLTGLMMTLFALVGLATALLSGLAAWTDDQSFPGGTQTLVLLGATPLLWLVAGLILWRVPSPIANTVLADAPDGNALPDWTARLQDVVLLGLGLYFIIDAATGLAYEAVYQIAVAEITNLRVDNQASLVANMVANGLKMLLGLVLVFGRRGLLGLMQRLREAGLH